MRKIKCLYIFLGALSLVFIGLRITGYLNWDWFWLIMPVLAPMFAILLCIIIISVLIMLAEFIDAWKMLFVRIELNKVKLDERKQQT